MSDSLQIRSRRDLEEQKSQTILAHILDPDNSPLPVELQQRFNRVVSAAQMLDSYHPSSVIPRLKAKYNISTATARRDIALAQDFFKSKHQFDWDYWQQWQIKELVDTIRTCKLNGKLKERINAHKVLREIIGEKIVGAEDPKRMEKNVFYIQLNSNNSVVNLELSKLQNLNAEEIREIVESLNTSIDQDEQIAEILNT